MNQQSDERRRYQRSRRSISVVEDSSGPCVMNHIDNISANGVLCHTIKPVPLMTKMGIALELPGVTPRRIDCEGVVIRCEPHEVGDDKFKVAILYTRVDEADRQAIDEFVEMDNTEDGD